MIPYYSSIDWDFFNKETNNIYINNIINLDNIFYNNISLFNSFNTEKANFSKIKKNNNNNKKYILFLDSEIDSKELEDSNRLILYFGSFHHTKFALRSMVLVLKLEYYIYKRIIIILNINFIKINNFAKSKYFKISDYIHLFLNNF